MNMEVTTAVNRNYKDTVFRAVFREKRTLLELYNALNGTDYKEESKLEVVLLQSALYLSMRNDVAFILDSRLSLYEHQSTHNPNIPLRDLFYVSGEYQKLVDTRTLYVSRRIEIPTPRFVVFYNGVSNQPERQILRLSDLYQIKDEHPMLELEVLVLNLNGENNCGLKERCRTLREYTIFVEKSRDYARQEGIDWQTAVERAIEECITEGILEEFLRANKAEVLAMNLFEWDHEYEMKKVGEAWYEQGLEDGMAKGMEKGIEKGVKAGIQEANLRSVRNLMNNDRGLTAERAMELLGIPEEEREGCIL